MKKLTLLACVIFVITSCKKEDDSITQPDNSVKWRGIYNCTSLINDATKIGSGAYTYNSTTVETINTLCIELHRDSIALRPVNTQYGATYFYNAKTQWVTTQPIEESYLMGGISGNQASISETLTWTDSVVHTIESTNFQLNSDNSIDFSYTEQVFSNPVIFRHYIGHYTK